ncbi:unnamed protein product [Knipowitschia caucasica]|uniref:GPI ethanolamine phosphate transferase 1 n=1 Tax=Knipowitschia caucasica TaxID=637954 RepID=A0AAV2MIM7_KNICA
MKVRGSVFVSALLLCQVLSVGLFLRGFFPAAVKSSPRSSSSDRSAEPLAGGLLNSSSSPPHALFGRVVIMLVDALREDFLFGSHGHTHMPYTRHLVERGASHSYVAKARAPTVTMPRIKVDTLRHTH